MPPGSTRSGKEIRRRPRATASACSTFSRVALRWIVDAHSSASIAAVCDHLDVCVAVQGSLGVSPASQNSVTACAKAGYREFCDRLAPAAAVGLRSLVLGELAG
jgi:hypothetical protein